MQQQAAGFQQFLHMDDRRDTLHGRPYAHAPTTVPGHMPQYPLPAHPPLLDFAPRTWTAPAATPGQQPSMPNAENAVLAGLSVGPLRSIDVDGHFDSLAGYQGRPRRKIISGEHLVHNVEVRTQEAWPNACLDSVAVPNPPDYQDMTPLQFCVGWSGKIMGEMPAELAGTVTKTQIRHLNRILTLSMELDFDVVKTYGAALLQSIEQGDNTWNNWPKMKDWQDRNMDTLRFRASSKKTGKDTEKDKGQGIKVEGVLESFIKSSRLCIAYQKGTCEEHTAHLWHIKHCPGTLLCRVPPA